MLTLRPALLTLSLAGAALLVTASGCGDDSASQAELEQARRQGAEVARRSAAIHELRKEVASLKRQSRASHPSPVAVESSPADETSAGDAGMVPASGTYFGQAEQRGARASVNKDYPIDMTFSAAGSSVNYPTLDCEGSLRPLGFDGPDRLYEETIEAGHCDSGGVWRVYVESDSRVAATWSLPTVDYRVAAVLLR
jgi:hypothetical protein